MFVETLPSVTFLVVTFNSMHSIGKALSSIIEQDYPAHLYDVTLVDNASSDGTPSWVREHYPQVNIVESPHNRGFAAANNLGAKYSTREWLALINPDVILNPDWLRFMVANAQIDCLCGIAGCKIFYSDGKTLNSTGGIILPNSITRHRGLLCADDGRFDELQQIDYAHGAAMLIRRDLWDNLDGFDSKYFLYFEEVDFCYRAKELGYRVNYIPQAVAYHDEAYSISKLRGMSFQSIYWYQRSRFRFICKHYTQGWRKFLYAELAYWISLFYEFPLTKAAIQRRKYN